MKRKWRLIRRFTIFKEIWYLARKKKKWWLVPLIILIIALAIVIILAQISSIAPFIYTIF